MNSIKPIFSYTVDLFAISYGTRFGISVLFSPFTHIADSCTQREHSTALNSRDAANDDDDDDNCSNPKQSLEMFCAFFHSFAFVRQRRCDEGHIPRVVQFSKNYYILTVQRNNSSYVMIFSGRVRRQLL